MTVALSGYRIGQAIYTGTRTLVYRGVRESDNQTVVIKFLANAYPTFSELLQFRNQYAIVKNLNIPGIIRPDSLEPYGNSYALVMADVGGISLREYSQIHSLEVAEVLTIALKLTEILHHLHSHRVIHKDIKPANILINPETKQVKLIDFSIASLLPRESQEILNPNVLEGTLAYISPEQTGRMNRGIDYRSDFYSLGVTFYELLTGKLPFMSDDPMELVHCHLVKQPIGIHTIKPSIPLILSQIVDKMMAKNSENRYQTALGLKHDLEICLVELQETGRIQGFELGKRDLTDRFIIPEQLYGRETEVETLLQAFERVSLGATEMMLVAGFSGIGKTAIVNEVHKPIVRQRGYFIKGKFDQFNRNIPLSAFVQAFRDLMGQLLSESDAQLQSWKTKILSEVGENGQVLIEVIPELRNIIGTQPAAQELSGSAAENRFNLLMQKFVQIFTSVEHPLVIFLDDLQWADSASLKLLQLLMQDTGYLLVLGAYRDHEVSPAHPFILIVDELVKTGTKVNTITLKPLSLVDLNQLVADTLNTDAKLAQPFTELVYQKTKGNPFFATQFLKALHDDKLINFNPPQYPLTKGGSQGGWQCDIAQVKASALTDDVVEFMAVQLQKLPAETQNSLKLAACIGAQFDLNTLAIVSQRNEIETAGTLWQALQQGLIIPNTEIYKFFMPSDSASVSDTAVNPIYRFLHDRVQQAAYSLIPNDQKQATHLSIGQFFQSSTSEADLETNIIFEIVGHFNVSSDLITQTDKKIELAKLNLIAGRKAKVSFAYDAAMEYFNLSLELLPEDIWQIDYGFSLALYESATEISYLCKRNELMQQLAEIVISQSKTVLDQIKVQEIQISAQIAQADLHMAINLAIDILKQLGIDLPIEPSVADIQAIQGEITTLLAVSSLQSLLELLPMTEATLLAALTILDSIQAACYLYNQSLFALVIMTEVKLSLLHGNSPLSPIAYAGYGSLLMNAFQQPDLGYQFGLLSLEMSDQFGDRFVVAQTVQIVATFILPLKQSLRDYAPIRQRGIVAAIESSNIESLGWHYATDAIDLFFSSTTLTDVESKLVAYGDRLLQFNQIFQLTTVQIVHQATLNLLGWAEDPSLLIGEVLDEVTVIANCQTVDTQATLAIIGVFKVILNCILGQPDRARDAAAWMRPYISAITGNTSLFWFYCYDSLAQIGVFPSLSASEQATALEQVVANQLVLQHLADRAPMNFQAKFDLVKAEHYRVLGRQYEAIEYYDRAICGAKSNEYIQEEGIANELAAKFYLDCGKEKVAAGYIQEAYYCYAKWGAKAKVVDLETRYPQLLQPILQQPQTSFNPLETLTSITHLSSQVESTIIYDSLDFASIIKAAQALSSTIKLDELLKQLTQIILQTSGADRCVLVLPHNKTWQVRAISTPENIKLCCEPLADNSDVPIKLIQYVKRTQSVVVIDNLQTDLPVIDDYLIQRNPKSVLCLPILNQGHLAGIICLKNKFTTGVFTNDRLTVIEFLCTQAAISLENARLYQESQQALAELQIVEVTLQQKEQFLRSIYDGAELVIVVIDLLEDGSFRYAGCNLAAEKASGIPSIDFVGKTLIELHGEQDGTFLNKQFTECVEGGFPITAENLLTLNGEKKWFLATHNPLKNENVRVYRIITTTIDISDRKQAEAIITQKSQELEQALGDLQQSQLQMIQTEKMSALGNLVAGVAHEINNPIGFLGGNIQPALNHINNLFGLLDLYQQQYPQPNADIQEEIETIDLDYIREDLPKLVGSMREGVKRIKDISISLRTFSRADTDYPVACNIHDGIDSTIMILKHRFKANETRPEIAVIKDYADSPLVECYAGQLNQVFMNLLANAIDALDESNIGKKYAEITNQITIKTELSTEKRQVIIQIQDNGIGMSEQVRSKIFDKLFTTKGVGKGTGLGMAIARQIVVEKHGGAIKVNSQLGIGTEFVLTLPLTEKK